MGDRGFSVPWGSSSCSAPKVGPSPYFPIRFGDLQPPEGIEGNAGVLSRRFVWKQITRRLRHTTIPTMNPATRLHRSLPATDERVPANTADEVNHRIRRQMEQRVTQLAASDKDAITRRLLELEHEWDVERVLEANAATVVLASATLAVVEDRRWGWLTVAVGAFLLQHSVQGWCPPLPALRRLGVRTAGEINEERLALRILRGDFAVPVSSPAEALVLAHEH